MLQVGGRYACGNANLDHAGLVEHREPAGPLNYMQINDLIAFIRAVKANTYRSWTPTCSSRSSTPRRARRRRSRAGWTPTTSRRRAPRRTRPAGRGVHQRRPRPPRPAGPPHPARRPRPGLPRRALPPSVGPVGATTIDEAALNIAFTQTSLQAPADAPFTIAFDNQDASTPHNIVIKDATGTAVFTGRHHHGPRQGQLQRAGAQGRRLHLRVRGAREHDRHAEGRELTDGTERTPRPARRRPPPGVLRPVRRRRLGLGCRQGALLVRHRSSRCSATSPTARTTSRSARPSTSGRWPPSSSGRRSTSARPRTRPCRARRRPAPACRGTRRRPSSSCPPGGPTARPRSSARPTSTPAAPTARRRRATTYVSHAVGQGNFDKWSAGSGAARGAQRRRLGGDRQHAVPVIGGYGPDGKPTTTVFSMTIGNDGTLGQWKTEAALALPGPRAGGVGGRGLATGSWSSAAPTARPPPATSGSPRRTAPAALGAWKDAAAAGRGERRRRRRATSATWSTSSAAGTTRARSSRLSRRAGRRRPARHGQGPERHRRLARTAPRRTCPASGPTWRGSCPTAPSTSTGGSDGTAPLKRDAVGHARRERRDPGLEPPGPDRPRRGHPGVRGHDRRRLRVHRRRRRRPAASPTSSARAYLAPQPPFFALGILGATIPALSLTGDIGQQIGYLNAAGVGTVNFILLLLIGWAFAHKEKVRAMLPRRRKQ